VTRRRRKRRPATEDVCGEVPVVVYAAGRDPDSYEEWDEGVLKHENSDMGAPRKGLREVVGVL
jgi:hypothetical protein